MRSPEDDDLEDDGEDAGDEEFENGGFDEIYDDDEIE